MNPTKLSKTTLILSAFAIGMASLATASACERASLDGIWTRYIPQEGVPDSGTRATWTIAGATLDSRISLEDDLSATGTYGPYFESQTRYAIGLDEKTCALEGDAEESVARSYRLFGEPTPDVSVSKDLGVRHIAYRIELSSDGTRATFTAPGGETFRMSRVK